MTTLSTLQPEEILFVDIETVSLCQYFNELDEEWQQLWLEKSKYQRERKQTSPEESYEEAGIYAEFGKIICVSAGFFISENSNTRFRVTSFFGTDEKSLLESFAQLLDQHQDKPFRMMCAHNGKEFDFPYLCRRMLVHGIALPDLLDLAGKKPWENPHLDTMEMWKFGDYKHYTSLDLLACILNIPTPKDDIDGSQIARIYYEENDLERIKKYCEKDVITVAQIFRRFREEPLLEIDK